MFFCSFNCISKLPNRSPKRSPLFAFGVGHFLERSHIADARQLWVAQPVNQLTSGNLGLLGLAVLDLIAAERQVGL